MMKQSNHVISKIDSNNQVTIPKVIRKALNLSSRDSIQWVINSDQTISVEKTGGDLWDIVKKQEEIYGNISTPEIKW